jgi:lysophospholipase L1-like esterase
MLPSNRPFFGAPTRRIPRLAAVAVPAAIGIGAALFWLNDQIGTPAYWRAGLVFLTGVEAAYLVAVASVLVGVPVLTLLAIRRRRQGARRSIVARAWLVGASLAISLMMAESVAAVRLHRARHSTVVPVGGLNRSMRVDRQRMWPPVSLEDVELPTRFADPPGDAVIDLVVVGESSAEGIPYQAWLSIGQLVAWKLGEAIPGRHVRLQIVATSGDTLELQHQRLARLERRPDLLIVYCGHNEFGSRLNGARDLPHYVDDRTPGAWRLLMEEVEAVSPLCELIRQASEQCRLELPPAPAGDRDLVDRPAYTPGEYALLLADFRRRLDAIATYAGRVGATAVFLIPPGNDAGFEPNRSFLPPETPRPLREAFRRDFLEARRLEGVDPAAATAAYRALVDRQPGFAEAHYRMGLLLDRAGDAEGAYRHFIAARDLDGYPVRCTVAFQDVYREIAARHDVILVDGQAELHAIGDRGRLDDHLFQDAMHPSLRGQIALAQAILRSLQARRAFGWPEGIPTPVIDPSRCVEHFGLGREAWKTICLWGIRFGDYTRWLRHDPTPHARRRRAYAEAYDRLVAGEAVESLGLPNIGIPRPVPTVTDGHPPPTSRSNPL